MSRHPRALPLPARPSLVYETRSRRAGSEHIAGLDEVGRGAWAGPVVAAAVVLPLERFDLARTLDGVRDSKQMTPKQRRAWAPRIQTIARSTGIGEASAQEVDSLGLIAATRLAMRRALNALSFVPDQLLIDHLALPGVDLPQIAITHGDALALSIAAASVIAKVHRDEAMTAWERLFPGYGFARHKGYGTREHQRALQRLGACEIHRRSFAPVAGDAPTSP